MTSVEWLSIDGNQVDESIAEAIASNLKQLKWLTVDKTGLTEKMLLRIVSGFPRLIEVYASILTRNSGDNGLGKSTEKAVKKIQPNLTLFL